MNTTNVLKQSQFGLEKKRIGRYQLRKPNCTDMLISTMLIVMVLTTLIYVFFTVEYKWEMFRPDLGWRILTNLFRFDLVADPIGITARLLNTVALAFVTTMFGAILGLPLGLLSASNLSNPWIVQTIKGMASFARAVPTIIWVLLFVSGYGLSATTAVVGMTFHSLAFFIKSYSEAFEEVEAGVIEALKATGASWLQIVTSAILPCAYTKMISWIAMRCEINFAAAVVIGPAVGVPGTIGTIISSFSRQGDYAGLGFSVFCVFMTALAFELFITRFKQKSIVQQ